MVLLALRNSANARRRVARYARLERSEARGDLVRDYA